jgi:hypothetical protein
MDIKTLSLEHKIYRIDNVLTPSENASICDEFQYNEWSFDKAEKFEDSSTYPWRGYLKNKNFNENCDIIGFNNVFINCAINVKYKLQSLLKLKTLKLQRINTNIQFFGMESSFHDDALDKESWSFVYFPGPTWSTPWGGEFVVNTSPGDYLYCPYIPNTAVFFPSHLEHMGYSPNRLCNVPRLSVAFVYQELR